MSKLIPTAVVDKNGKITTVYKRPEVEKKGIKNLFGVIPQSSEPNQAELLDAIIVELEELKVAGYGSPRKMFAGISHESLQGVLAILSRDDAEADAIYPFVDRFENANNKKLYSDWVDEYVALYPEMKTWRCGHPRGASDDIIAKLVCEMMHDRNKGTSAEVTLGVMKLTCALIGTDLAKPLHHRTTPYGLSFFMNEEYVMDFATRHPEPEMIEEACALIASGSLNHLEDLDPVFSGEVPVSIVEGML